MIAWLLARLCSHFEQIDTASLFFLLICNAPQIWVGRLYAGRHSLMAFLLSLCVYLYETYQQQTKQKKVHNQI